MANVTPTITQVSGYTPFDGWKVTWANIGDSDTCLAVPLSNYADCSAQAFGDFTGPASVAIQGSNDATALTATPQFASNGTWFPKTNPAGTTIALTAASGAQVTEATIWTRPSSTGGNASSITVVMFFRTSISPR